MEMLQEVKDDYEPCKCGQITTLLSMGRKEFFLDCDLCDYRVENLDLFISHVYESHLQEFTGANSIPTSDVLYDEVSEDDIDYLMDVEEDAHKSSAFKEFENVVVDMDENGMENSMQVKVVNEPISAEYDEEQENDYEVQEYEDREEKYADEISIEFGAEDVQSEKHLVTSNIAEDVKPSQSQSKDYQTTQTSKVTIKITEEEQFLLDFIDVYKSLPALWNVESSLYNNPETKSMQYQTLHEKYKERYPNAHINETKKKINLLRSRYRSHLKKVPRYKHYLFDKMRFLNNIMQNLQTKPNDDELFEDDGEYNMDYSMEDSSCSKEIQYIIVDDERKFILEFIKLYQSLPALWNVKNKHYRDPVIRSKHLNTLLEKLKEKYPDAQLKDVKRKISRLRTNYRAEKRLIPAIRTEPKLYYYNEISFLDQNESESKSGADKSAHCENLQKKSNDAEFFEDDGEYNMENSTEDWPCSKESDERTFTLEFIKVYQSLPALWNTKHIHYRDAAIRTKQYNTLLEKFREMYPDAELKDVKKKINALRTNYRRGKHTIQKNRTKSKHYYYSEFSFLDQNESESKSGADKSEHSEMSCDDDTLPKKILTHQQEPTDEKTFILELIELYKTMPSIWDTNSPDYYDQKLQNKNYKILLNKYKEKYPSAVLQDLKVKINILRTNYEIESKRIAKNQIKESKLYYFQAMNFLPSNESTKLVSKSTQSGSHDMEVSCEVVTEDMQSEENLIISNITKGVGFVLTRLKSSQITQKSEVRNRDDVKLDKAKSETPKRSGLKDLPSVIANEPPVKLSQEQQFLLEFVEVYKSLPALWNVKSPLYSDRQIRKIQYQTLHQKYKEKFPNADMQEMKNKINTLRTNHRRALKRGPPYEHYLINKLSFLTEIMEQPAAKTAWIPIIPRSIRKDTTLNDEEFIELAKAYESCPILWNDNVTEYYFSNRRRETMNKLLEKFNNISGLELTKDVLEREICQLRRTCSAEKRRKILCQRKNVSYKADFPLYEHIAFLESYIQPFECSKCTQVINGIILYKNHVASHDGSLPFKCHICGHRFKVISNLTVHLRTHVRDCTFSCKLCDRSFVTNTKLKRHMLTHTGDKPWVCHICGKGFGDRTALKYHMLRHENLRRYKCKICTKAFYKGSKLKIHHAAVHLKLRNIICDVCNKGFPTKYHLGRHNIIHREKRFVCKICGKAYAQGASLNWHMKSDHGVIPSTVTND